jgi:DNA-binding SARP family transcriptional activator
MTPRTPLRLELLGGFRLWQGSQEIAVASSSQRLVALLALNDRPLGRLRVAGILWPDYSTERSLADLRSALWRVKRSSGWLVTATSSLLGLCDDIEVDVRKLTVLAQRLSEAAAGPVRLDPGSVGLAEFSGELLPDWYDEWLQDERERLRQTRLHALEALAGVLSSLGRHGDAIQAALAAIRLEPLRESAHRTLIEAHLAEGNWSEARRHFRQCRKLLMEELGVEPSESMRQLLEERARLAAQRSVAGRASTLGRSSSLARDAVATIR